MLVGLNRSNEKGALLFGQSGWEIKWSKFLFLFTSDVHHRNLWLIPFAHLRV